MPSDDGSSGPRPVTDGANAVHSAELADTPIGSPNAGAHLEQLEIAHSSVADMIDATVDTDGRTLRRTRNREAVIRALLELMRAGAIEPSVAEIAELAGVSHRSVFRYFDDLTDLVRAAFDQVVTDAIPLAVIADLGVGSLEHRVDALVDARLRVYGYTYQVGRIARLRSASIPAINESLKEVSSLMRMQLRNHFREELTALDPSDAELVTDAVLTLVSFEAYDMQLRLLDSSPEHVRKVWCRALVTLLRA